MARAAAAAAAAAGTVQFGCPRAEGWGHDRQQDIDLNPQIVCSNKLFQVRCHFHLLLFPPPSPPIPRARAGVVLGNALHLPGAISQWATRAGTIVVYTNNLLRTGKMHNSSLSLPTPAAPCCCLYCATS